MAKAKRSRTIESVTCWALAHRHENGRGTEKFFIGVYVQNLDLFKPLPGTMNPACRQHGCKYIRVRITTTKPSPKRGAKR